MSSLYHLPDHIVESIIAQALDLEPPSADLENRRSVTFKNGKKIKGFATSPLSLLLPCKRFNAITSRLILSRAAYTILDQASLETLSSTLPAAQLFRLRNMNITLYSGDDDYMASHHTGASSETEVLKITKSLNTLPGKVQRLGLSMPYHDTPMFTLANRTHPCLKDSLWRFRDLEELSIFAPDHWINTDLFSAVQAPLPWIHGRVNDVGKHGTRHGEHHEEHTMLFSQPRRGSMFPCLQRLTLSGALGSLTTAAHMTEALSEKHLPCLQSLHFDGLLCENRFDDDDRSWPFSPECFATMHNLRAFSWKTFPYEEITKSTKEDPHIPPTRSHLKLLKEKHGKTLKTLKIDYTGWWVDFNTNVEGDAQAVDIEDEDWGLYLQGMELVCVQILCPELNIEIKKGEPSGASFGQ